MSKKKLCDVSKCHAACCYNVPMEKGYLSAYKKRIANKVMAIGQWGDEGKDAYAKRKMGDLGRAHYLMITDKNPAKNKCPFLRADCKCNIYENRPVICRRYGQTPNERFLHCGYLQGEEDMPTQQETTGAILRAAHDFLSQSGS